VVACRKVPQTTPIHKQGSLDDQTVQNVKIGRKIDKRADGDLFFRAYDWIFRACGLLICHMIPSNSFEILKMSNKRVKYRKKAYDRKFSGILRKIGLHLPFFCLNPCLTMLNSFSITFEGLECFVLLFYVTSDR